MKIGWECGILLSYELTRIISYRVKTLHCVSSALLSLSTLLLTNIVNGECGIKNLGLMHSTASLMVILVQEKLSKFLPSVVVRSRSRNAGGKGDCNPKRPVGWGIHFRLFVLHFFNLASSLLVFAGSISEVCDSGLDYFGEVLISAATKEVVCDAHFFQLGNIALFIIQ